MKDSAWRHLSHDQRKSAIECGCGSGSVQDMEHVMTQCLFTREHVDKALIAGEAVRGEGTLTTIQDRNDASCTCKDT